MPGAVGMFCAAAYNFSRGDSAPFTTVLTGRHPDPENNEYFSNIDIKNPLVFPGQSFDILKKFPPSLLITSTRDSGLSSVAYTHSQLVKLDVDAELHVWEGLGHAFFFEPDLPESREVYDVVVKFFDNHLGVLN